MSLYSSGLEANTGMGLVMHYGLRTGNRLLPMKDEDTDLDICSTSKHFLSVYPELLKSFELKLPRILLFFLHISGLILTLLGCEWILLQL